MTPPLITTAKRVSGDTLKNPVKCSSNCSALHTSISSSMMPKSDYFISVFNVTKFGHSQPNWKLWYSNKYSILTSSWLKEQWGRIAALLCRLITMFQPQKGHFHWKWSFYQLENSKNWNTNVAITHWFTKWTACIDTDFWTWTPEANALHGYSLQNGGHSCRRDVDITSWNQVERKFSNAFTLAINFSFASR